ncbi:MAG: TraR/DksA C4-type zinc finger protein [Phycisphaerales bacterium]
MITTRKPPAATKKPRIKPASSVPMEPEPKPSKPIKSRLSPKTLDGYRTLLLIKRAELVGDLSAMEAEALRSDGGNLSNVPIHMADIGTDTYDQDFMLGLAEKERGRLREIDEALRRIDDRTYGVCQMTGKAIPKARLAAKPWAKYTIEAAREVEAGRDY